MNKRSIISASAVIGIAVSISYILGCGAYTSSASNITAVPAETPSRASQAKQMPSGPTLTDGEFDGKEIVKTDAEWKKELPADAYNVLREQGTERPYSGKLTTNHKHGTYYCAACGLAIFSSEAKFESGTGWPSFFQPIFKKNVIEKEDNSLGEVRTEIECARCHSHLGHVFDDGPKPTGLRYCMNSVAMKFRETK